QYIKHKAEQNSIKNLLSMSVGFKRNLPLPAPPAIASILRSKAIEFLEKWNASFDAAQIQQERRERELRTNEILLNKFEIIKENFASIKSEIQLTIDEIGECLDILHLDSLKEAEKVHENSENKVELYKLLIIKHLVAVQEYISILIRVEVTDNRFKDSALKEFIDILNHIQSIKRRCEESSCALPNTKDDGEEDIWEGNYLRRVAIHT
ncbi:hypothetical protein RJ641_027530, partial [Dillenia turbinata]